MPTLPLSASNHSSDFAYFKLAGVFIIESPLEDCFGVHELAPGISDKLSDSRVLLKAKGARNGSRASVIGPERLSLLWDLHRRCGCSSSSTAWRTNFPEEFRIGSFCLRVSSGFAFPRLAPSALMFVVATLVAVYDD